MILILSVVEAAKIKGLAPVVEAVRVPEFQISGVWIEVEKAPVVAPAMEPVLVIPRLFKLRLPLVKVMPFWKVARPPVKSVLLSSVAPLIVKLVDEAAPPVVTTKLFPPTVKSVPVTSKPLVASILPETVSPPPK